MALVPRVARHTSLAGNDMTFDGVASIVEALKRTTSMTVLL